VGAPQPGGNAIRDHLTGAHMVFITAGLEAAAPARRQG
jgi:hypothetical protein